MNEFINNKIDYASLQVKFCAYKVRLQNQIKKFNKSSEYFKHSHPLYLVLSIIGAVCLVGIFFVARQFSIPQSEFFMYAIFGSVCPLVDLCGFANYKIQQARCNNLNNKINKMNLDLYNVLMAQSNYTYQSNTPEVKHIIDPNLAVDPRLSAKEQNSITIKPRIKIDDRRKLKLVSVQDDEQEK
ncbi:MAG: hypothetical protein WCX32_00435 [Clostridia bacterium]|jgi:hypothetical protein|nr:hypothetical protein [Clostridia bacterium]MDD4276035.1 hypothetical protein [Clostridia bacterium]